MEKKINSPNTFELVSKMKPGFEHGQGDDLYVLPSIITIVPLTSIFM